MLGKTAWLDFEFSRIREPRVNLVSCVVTDGIKRQRYWLHNSPPSQKKLAADLKDFKTIIGYMCVAEARSFMSLALDPLKFQWIDMFLEYRMLTNHNDDLQWGKQLADGKVIYARKPKPKWERDEEEKGTGFKATHSLAEATYKLTGEIRDTVEKDETRKLIISDPKKFTDEQRRQILEYNDQDVVFLPALWKRIQEEFGQLVPEYKHENYIREAVVRGRYSAHTAIMEARGYPINVEATRNFSNQIPSILMECQRDINAQFPEIKPFKWKRPKSNFSWNQKATKQWIAENHDVSKWMETDGGDIALSLEAFERFYQFKHDYPRGNFGAQMLRFLKLKQSLYGFSESGGKRKNFWDSVGSDGRVRPYMNIYGAQSSRSQPAASGFMFLKPAWMRALVQPAKGHFIAGIDYGQQEFFLGALESHDETMIQAYLSGDPYMFGAKLAGVVPQNATKESHKLERDVFKNTYLGIGYGMTKWGLAIKLTGDTGREHTEEDAQDQIDLFEEAFEDYIIWKKQILEDYRNGECIRLPCGWMMFCDNDNDRSVQNVPIQGFGATIMRKAVDLAVERGCKVLFTLHDAIYIEDKIGNEKMILALYAAMREAFQFYFKGTPYHKVAAKIKLDPFAWSPNYKKNSQMTVGFDGLTEIVCPTSNLYIDERAASEYEKFSRFFGKPDTDLL